MFAFIWGTVVCAAILMIASSMMSTVRCDSFLDAVKTALIYGLLCFVGKTILAVPIVLTTIGGSIMTFGLGFPFIVIFWGMVIGTPSLYIADQLVEGFEIRDVSATAGVVFFLGCGHFLAKVLKLV